MTALELSAVEPVIELVEIASIERDPEMQVRAKGVNKATVDAYALAMQASPDAEAGFPHILLYRIKGKLYLCDGAHRLESTRKVHGDAATIRAEIREGTRRDALLAALESAKEFGLRFSNADKRRAVQLLLADPAMRKKKDQALADVVGVSQPFVWKIRKQRDAITDIASADPDAETDPVANEKPSTLDPLLIRFRKLLSAVPGESRAKFGDEIVSILSEPRD